MTELKPELLLQAYAIGVFPMAEDRDDPELVQRQGAPGSREFGAGVGGVSQRA